MPFTEADFRVANFQPITPKQLALLNKLERGVYHSAMSLEDARSTIGLLLLQQEFYRIANIIDWDDFGLGEADYRHW